MDSLENYEIDLSSVYSRKPTTADPRLGDLVLGPNATAASRGWAIVGHPDDDGVAIGGGRRGSQGGPGAIRRHLLKMTPHATLSGADFRFRDFGDLRVIKFELAQRHAIAEAAQLKLYREGFRVLALGGGHDYGFPDAAAFLKSRAQGPSGTPPPLVINIDAHMDVRPSETGLSSGTPFYRLLTEFDPKSFEFVEIGIQSHCNARGQMDWARGRGAQILTYDEILMSGQNQSVAILQFMAEKLTSRKRAVFLSVDMDAFEAPIGSGTSAPATVGLRADEFLKVLVTLAARLDLRGVGLYETAPSLDRDEMTARFAARLAFETLFRTAP